MKRRSFIRKTGLGAISIGIAGNPLPVTNQKSKMPYDTVRSSKTLRIAVVQQEGNPGMVKENRQKALHFAEQALEKKADAILFHEEMLVGYVENLRELAETAEGPTTKAFQKLLKGSKTLVIYGLTEKDGDNYYISAPIVSENGLIDNYRKTHLWWHAEGLRHEPTYYTPGNRLVTFNIKGYKSGIMICYDGGFPEMTRSYANLGCSVLFWMNNRRSRGHKEVKNLAFDNSMIMPTSCCCGLNEKGLFCEGGSNITGAKGELINEIWNEEGIIVSDVFPGEVNDLREKNYKYRGLRSDLYYY